MPKKKKKIVWVITKLYCFTALAVLNHLHFFTPLLCFFQKNYCLLHFLKKKQYV